MYTWPDDSVEGSGMTCTDETVYEKDGVTYINGECSVKYLEYHHAH